ncbi:MAG: hypothetical protein ACRDD1_14135, partial [Planctomycetia bacterium]
QRRRLPTGPKYKVGGEEQQATTEVQMVTLAQIVTPPEGTAVGPGAAPPAPNGANGANGDPPAGKLHVWKIFFLDQNGARGMVGYRVPKDNYPAVYAKVGEKTSITTADAIDQSAVTIQLLAAAAAPPPAAAAAKDGPPPADGKAAPKAGPPPAPRR